MSLLAAMLSATSDTAEPDARYLESIARSWEMLAATEAWAKVTDHPDADVREQAERTYRATAEALLSWMADTKPSDPDMVEETWAALCTHLEAIRAAWRAEQRTEGANL